MKNEKTRALTECAVLTALAIVLSYIKIPIGSASGASAAPSTW